MKSSAKLNNINSVHAITPKNDIQNNNIPSFNNQRAFSSKLKKEVVPKVTSQAQMQQFFSQQLKIKDILLKQHSLHIQNKKQGLKQFSSTNNLYLNDLDKIIYPKKECESATHQKAQSMSQDLFKQLKNEEIKQIVKNKIRKADENNLLLTSKHQNYESSNQVDLINKIVTKIPAPNININININQALSKHKSKPSLKQEVNQNPSKDDRKKSLSSTNLTDQNSQRVLNQKQFIYYLMRVEQSFKQPLKNTFICKSYREHFVQTYQGVYFSQFLKPQNPQDNHRKKIILKKHSKHKKTVIFDLDETLVHCNDNPQTQSDIVLNINITKTDVIQAGINIRPLAQWCLKTVSENFEVIVFTASHSCYADKVLDYLDPQGDIVSHRLFREHCTMTTGGMYTKDLRILNRNLEDIVLIDNAAYSYGWQLENGIPILPFYDNKSDQELKLLTEYLLQMKDCQDVRQWNRKHLQLYKMQELEGSPEQTLENIFGYSIGN